MFSGEYTACDCVRRTTSLMMSLFGDRFGQMQDAVEAAGSDGLTFAPGHVDGRQEVGQRRDLGIAWPIMDAVDLRAGLLLQRFGGADVCLDHEFFDELVRIEAFATLHAGDFAVLENDPVLGRVDLKRLTLLARLPDACDRRPRAASGLVRAAARFSHSAYRRSRLALAHTRVSRRSA